MSGLRISQGRGGLGDGGAHVDMLGDAGYPTYPVGTWVRAKEKRSPWKKACAS